MGPKSSKDDEHVRVLFVIGIYLFAGMNPVVGTPCVKEATQRNLPMVNFCSETDVTITSVSIVVDGYNYSTSDAAKRCICVARATLPAATQIAFKNILSSSPLQNDCESKVVFNQDSKEERSQSCYINGSMPFNVAKNIEITLIKETRSADTRYCFYIELDQVNPLEITCNRTFLWMNNSTESKTEKSSHTLYIAVGSGVGGVVLVVIVVICLLTISRRQKGSNRESDEPQEVNDENGLQYNTLYVSSDDDCVQQNINNRQEKHDENVHQVAYQVEENYGEIDLEEIPENKTKKVSAMYETGKCEMNLDCDYSEIEMDEQVLPSISSKTDKSSKSKCLSGTGNDTFMEDSHSKNKNDNSSSVRHVFSPGGNGFEYAVVEKRNNDGSRNDAYAVVDKTRKKDI